MMQNDYTYIILNIDKTLANGALCSIKRKWYTSELVK